MNTKRKGAARKHAPNQNRQTDYNKLPTKREIILAWLIDESEKGSKVTRFDAEHIGCHVLNTTVSEIEKYDSVKIERQFTKRPTRFDKPVSCCEYWIAKSELMNARKALTAKQARRAA